MHLPPPATAAVLRAPLRRLPQEVVVQVAGPQQGVKQAGMALHLYGLQGRRAGGGGAVPTGAAS